MLVFFLYHFFSDFEQKPVGLLAKKPGQVVKTASLVFRVIFWEQSVLKNYSLWFKLSRTLRGKGSQLLTENPAAKTVKPSPFKIFGMSFSISLYFWILSKTFSESRQKIAAGVSGMHFTCPEDHFEGKSRFLNFGNFEVFQILCGKRLDYGSKFFYMLWKLHSSCLEQSFEFLVFLCFDVFSDFFPIIFERIFLAICLKTYLQVCQNCIPRNQGTPLW